MYDTIKAELARAGFEPKLLPNTTPKKPQGMAPIRVTYRICSMGRPTNRAITKASAGWSKNFSNCGISKLVPIRNT